VKGNMTPVTPSLFQVNGFRIDLPLESNARAAIPRPKEGEMSNRLWVSVIVIGVLLIMPFCMCAQLASPQSNAGVTVYVTARGTKYHTASCRYIRKGARPMKLKDAVKAGYLPCSVCKPPTLEKQPGGSAPRV
jgi:hypothetical protein